MRYDETTIRACKQALLDMAAEIQDATGDCVSCAGDKRERRTALLRAATSLRGRVLGVTNPGKKGAAGKQDHP